VVLLEVWVELLVTVVLVPPVPEAVVPVACGAEEEPQAAAAHTKAMARIEQVKVLAFRISAALSSARAAGAR
jgi:hypothetical protein